MNYRIRLTMKSTPEDCEKLVTPGIVFINTNHPAFEEVRKKGFMICIGWWHWSIKFGIIYL